MASWDKDPDTEQRRERCARCGATIQPAKTAYCRACGAAVSPSSPSGRGFHKVALTMSPVSATDSRVALEELIALFVGDGDTRPCPHLNLVLAICERVRPRSSSEILDLLYPMGCDATDDLIDRIVRWGHELWLQRVYERDPAEWHALAHSTAE